MTVMRVILVSFVLMLNAFMAVAEVVDKIAVVVNNEIVTYGEIDRTMSPVYEKFRTIYEGDELAKKIEEARQRILNQLIEDKLILSEARKKKIEVPESEIDSKLAETRKRFSSEEEFEAAMASQGLSVVKLKERYKDQLLTRELIDMHVGSKVSVSPSEIKDYYDKHADEFKQQEEVKLRMILIRPKDGLAGDKARQLVIEIERRLKGGEDLAVLAKIYTEGPNQEEGGLLDYMKREDLHPEIDKAIADLEMNQTSGVVQTSLGYHFFRIEEKKEARTLKREEVRNLIEEKLFGDKIRDKIKDWVNGLRKNAYIAFK